MRLHRDFGLTLAALVLCPGLALANIWGGTASTTAAPPRYIGDAPLAAPVVTPQVGRFAPPDLEQRLSSGAVAAGTVAAPAPAAAPVYGAVPPAPYGANPPAGLYGAVPYGGQPYGGLPYGAVPYGGVPYGGVPFGVAPYGTLPYGAAPYGAAPYGAMPFGGIPYGTPYGAVPYGGYPFGGYSPYGGFNNRIPSGRSPFLDGFPFRSW